MCVLRRILASVLWILPGSAAREVPRCGVLEGCHSFRRAAMVRNLIFLLTALALPVSTQVKASAAVRTACSVSAAPNSLQPSVLEPVVFLPDGRGVINIETESIGPRGSWVVETEIEGYRGDGYLRWAGHDLFFQPAVDSLAFRFRLKEATTYLIRLRNRHDHPDPTAENDCWFRLDSGPWIKLVDSWGSDGVARWSFNAFLESTGAFPEYDLEPGDHLVELSPRSANFKIDSLHVLPKTVWAANAIDPESSKERDRPILGTKFGFDVDDPTDTWAFTPFATLAVPFLSLPGNYAPCGRVFGGVGELLLAPELGLVTLGTRIWAGPGDPAVFLNVIPYEPMFLGETFTIQALFSEPGHIRLTDAIDIVIGDN